MDHPPARDFGKRKPVTPAAASPPVKRSRHVALLLSGALAVGGGAYALMPSENCTPSGPAMATPSSAQGATACPPHGSSGGGGHGGGSWSRSNFFGGEPASSSSSTSFGSGETARGGFGSFARAFAGHFSGG